jgi:glutaredoxin
MRRAPPPAPARRLLALSLAAAWLLAAPLPAWAVYRIVGPGGQVTFTDMPPTAGAAAQAPGASLSPALRAAMRNEPVTIYTMAHCPACRDGVALLRRRGVPYDETTIDDAGAARRFEQISHGVRRLPLLVVGSRQLEPGFNAASWNSALDTAGYPATSQLPPDWNFAPPQPLTAASAATGGAAPPARAGSVPVRPPPNPHAPPGFQF